MIVSPRVGSRSSSDETEIRSPDPVSPCDAIDETESSVSSSASRGACDETQIVSGFRHTAPFPVGGQIPHLCLFVVADGHLHRA